MDPAQRILIEIPPPPFNVMDPDNQLVATVNNRYRKVSIIAEEWQANLKISGIHIPPSFREKFNGKSIVFYDDPLFYDAFIDAECPHLVKNGYKIEETWRGEQILNSIPPPPFNIINPHTGRVIVKVKVQEIEIIDRHRKCMIQGGGIYLPPFLRERFGDVSIIDFKNPLFYNAFLTAGCWNLIRDGCRIKKGNKIIQPYEDDVII